MYSVSNAWTSPSFLASIICLQTLETKLQYITKQSLICIIFPITMKSPNTFLFLIIHAYVKCSYASYKTHTSRTVRMYECVQARKTRTQIKHWEVLVGRYTTTSELPHREKAGLPACDCRVIFELLSLSTIHSHPVTSAFTASTNMSTVATITF